MTAEKILVTRQAKLSQTNYARSSRMAAPATKKAPAKTPTAAPPATTITTTKTNGEEDSTVTYGKPDQVAYNKEQDELKAQIDALQPKLVSLCTLKLRHELPLALITDPHDCNLECNQGTNRADV